MVIQCEKIWLFEWTQTDPFIFNKIDGVDIIMNALDDRIIDLIDIDKAIFYIDTVLKGGIQRTLRYGGEDFMPYNNNGKLNYSYSLQFNVPLEFRNNIEQLNGKEFSLVAMRRDLSLFAIFGRFIIPMTDIDNEVQQRVTMECSRGNYPMFEVNSLNVTDVINIIGNIPPYYPVEPEVQFGFDYELDFGLN